LINLEKYTGENYNSLKLYLSSEPNIRNNEELAKLAENLITYCEIQMGNYPTAISRFENIIKNPKTPEDSIFAVIDLGFTYLLMENQENASLYIGDLKIHKPSSLEDFEENRDYLLTLLPGIKN